MFVIQVGRHYFSARRGYVGGLVPRCDATLFSLAEAMERAARIVGAAVVQVLE